MVRAKTDSLSVEPAGPWDRRRRSLGLAAVVGGVFVAALDLHIRTRGWDVVPSIGVPDHLIASAPAAKWVGTAVYVALVLVSLPLWGKLSDLYGRRRLWLVGVALFMAGSAGFGAFWELVPTEFLLAVVVQPFGVGAICVLGPALIGDLYPPSERAKWHGVLAAAFGLALIGVPTIRQLIWEIVPALTPLSGVGTVMWPLYVNLTVGALVVLASWFGLPAVRESARRTSDLWGAAAFVAAAGLFLVAFDLASPPSDSVFPWFSPFILTLLVGAAIMLVVLMIAVRRASDPFVDLRLLTNRTYLIAVILGIVVGLTFVNAHDFALLFNIWGIGENPSSTNPLHFPDRVAVALAFAVGGIVAGHVAVRTGRNKLPILALLLIGTVGSLLLSRMTSRTGLVELALGMAVVSLSLGGLSALLFAAVQNALPRRSLGEVTADLVFLSALGVFLITPIYFWFRSVSYAHTLDRLGVTMPENSVNITVEKNSLGVVFLLHAILLAIGAVIALWLPEPLGLRGGLFKKRESGPSLQERLRAREEEQHRALEASRARAEQRRRSMAADRDDADDAERPAGGPRPPAT